MASDPFPNPSTPTRAELGLARQVGLFEYLDRMAKRAEAMDPVRPAVAVLCTVLGLVALGLLLQVSHAATTLSVADFKAELRTLLTYRLLALAGLLVAFRIGPDGLRRFIPFFTALTLFALILVYVPAINVEYNGSTRWIEVPFVGLTIQPSELARVVAILWVADRCARLGNGVEDMRRGFLPMVMFGLLLFALIVFQPDLGGSLLFLICFVSTMWVGGARPSHLMGTFGFAGGSALLIAFTTLAYVRERVAVWVGDSGNDQVTRTTLAMASGDWLGVGLTHGQWRNSGVQYMQTDYAFALVGEELGLVGLGLVLALFTAFAWFSLQLVLALRGRYAGLVAFGLLTSIVLQAVLHFQVVTGLAPPKGMNLPFLSAGGTSLVASCLAVGLALGAARTKSDHARAPLGGSRA